MFKKIGMALRVATGNLRALPDFVIIGAARAATTSLYRYLVRHPQIVPARTKEVHYFDIYYAKGLRWYRAHFPTTGGLRRLTRKTGERHITGESSPYYLSVSATRLTGPSPITISRSAPGEKPSRWKRPSTPRRNAWRMRAARWKPTLTITA